jgi:hypothetical protein
MAPNNGYSFASVLTPLPAGYHLTTTTCLAHPHWLSLVNSVRVTLRLAVYSRSFRLGAKLHEDHELYPCCHSPYVTSSLMMSLMHSSWTFRRNVLPEPSGSKTKTSMQREWGHVVWSGSSLPTCKQCVPPCRLQTSTGLQGITSHKIMLFISIHFASSQPNSLITRVSGLCFNIVARRPVARQRPRNKVLYNSNC